MEPRPCSKWKVFINGDFTVFFLFFPIEKLVHSWCTKKSYPVVQVKMLGYDEKTGTENMFNFCF